MAKPTIYLPGEVEKEDITKDDILNALFALHQQIEYLGRYVRAHEGFIRNLMGEMKRAAGEQPNSGLDESDGGTTDQPPSGGVAGTGSAGEPADSGGGEPH